MAQQGKHNISRLMAMSTFCTTYHYVLFITIIASTIQYMYLCLSKNYCIYFIHLLLLFILMYYCLFVLQLSRQDGVHSVDIKVPPKYHLFTNIFFFTFYFLLSCELCQNNQLLMFRIFVFLTLWTGLLTRVLWLFNVRK